MRNFRFVHTADLHLDSPFRGLSEVAPGLQNIMREATFRAFQGIVDLCIKREANFLLIAGDIHDSADRSLRALARLRSEFERLAEHHISVYLCHGNHDPLSGWGAKYQWPENVHVFGPGVVEGKPVLRKGLEIARVYGVSYGTDHVSENLARLFQKEEKAPWSIGLLHTNVGHDPNHQNYAPCDLQDLVRAKMDYWALGHIHAHRVLNPVNPAIIYPGNPQGRNPKESGPRGCYVVDVHEAGKVQYEFVPVDVVRWQEEIVNIEGVRDIEELLTYFDRRTQDLRGGSEGRGIVVRWRMEGRGSLHRDLSKSGKVEDLLITLRDKWGNGSSFVWAESIVDQTDREVDKEALGQEENLLGDFLRLAEESSGSPNQEIRQVISPLFDDPRVHRYMSSPRPEQVRQWIKAAEGLGVDRLLAGDD